MVLHSQDDATLAKALRVLKPGGKLISTSCPPDPAFAKEIGTPWILRPATRFLSYRARKAAKRRQVGYSFLFMRANGEQLREITSLIDAGAITPVVDRVFGFEATNERDHPLCGRTDQDDRRRLVFCDSVCFTSV